MLVHRLFLGILSLVCLVTGLANQIEGDTTLTTSSTLAWTTITTNGIITTSSYFFKQSFISTYTAATATVSSADIGMGSLSGSVGGVRSYSHTTISQNDGAVAGLNSYGGLGGLMLAVIGALA